MEVACSSVKEQYLFYSRQPSTRHKGTSFVLMKRIQKLHNFLNGSFLYNRSHLAETDD
jgi:hypothetical protein